MVTMCMSEKVIIHFIISCLRALWCDVIKYRRLDERWCHEQTYISDISWTVSYHPYFLLLTVYILIVIPWFKANVWMYSKVYFIFNLWYILFVTHCTIFASVQNVRSYGNLTWNRYNMWKNATKISHWFISMLTRSEKLSYIVNVNEPQPGFQGLVECIYNKIVAAI